MAMRSKIPLTNVFKMAIASFETSMSGWTEVLVATCSKISLAREFKVFEMLVGGWTIASAAMRLGIALAGRFEVVVSFGILALGWTEPLAAVHVSLTSELKVVEMLVGGWTKASAVM